LFGQFVYRRLPSYCILAAAFLFSALVMLPFLLSFPGAFKVHEEIIGGSQSSIWVWHIWHMLFPATVALSLIAHERGAGRRVPRRWVVRSIAVAILAAVLLVSLVTVAVTIFHDQLPVLIDDAEIPLKRNFFWVGGITAAVTAAAFVLAVRLARRRSILHVWLALVLLALLADEAASLGAYPRYALGWYFGRIDWMLAVSTLLVVFLTDINRLYHRLAEAMHELSATNRKLSAMVEEKDAVLAELRQSEERIRWMAYHDAITDLPNRRLLMERLTHTLAQAARHGHSTALLFLDLDRFKQVNDFLGHDVGDALIKEVAIRLKRCVRAGDIISRLGGDEFVIVLPEISAPRDAAVVANKALKIMTDTMVIMGHQIHMTVSIGVAISSKGQSLDADELLRRADEAMYAAKKAGRNQMAVSASA
jgi:diguanylate cyclase (GGDEF)-like protein